MQLDFAMVALGFQKAGAQAKEGGTSKAGGSQSMLETIIDDGMVKPNPFVYYFTCHPPLVSDYYLGT